MRSLLVIAKGHLAMMKRLCNRAAKFLWVWSE
jgi:hypothetical protein